MILEGRPSVSKKPAKPVGRSTTTSASRSSDVEKPPPYTPGGLHHTNGPLSPPPEHNSSTSNPHAGGSTSNFQHPGGPTSSFHHTGSNNFYSASRSRILPEAPVSDPSEPPATVNQVHLSAKNEDIIGTFYIDPRKAIVKKKKKAGKQPYLPHASFRSRAGAIQLALGTTGDARDTPKATVQVTSGTGNIDIHLLPVPASKPRLALDAQSRQGDVCVHIPNAFSGMIQLNTRKGTIEVLPALSQKVKVLKATDKETILLMGISPVAPIAPDVYLTDLCQLSTTSGRVIVGLAGLDKQPEKEGFWKRLGHFFRGD